MKKTLKYIISVAVIVLLVAIDRITKYLSVVYLKDKEPFTIIKGVLQLTYLQNTGSAWGMLAGKQTLFIIITFLLLIFMAFIFVIMPQKPKYKPLSCVITVLAAGAIGNLIDRIANGYVHDFIYFQIIDFPVFNFADICVSLSMVALVILILFKYKDKDFDFIKAVFQRGNNGENDKNNEGNNEENNDIGNNE